MIKAGTGSVFIVAAPSGGGKTSLVRQLVNRLSDIEVSISHTTRPKRPREAQGVDYFFIDDEGFEQMVAANAFIEHARVFNAQYGTSAAQIQSRLAAGIDVILDIDWQGAAAIKRHFPQAVGVFILPPSLEVLQQRLQSRRQDDAHVIADRMKMAHEEMRHYDEFDYLIVNDTFDEALSALLAIVIATRHRLSVQEKRVGKLLSFLTATQ